MHLAWALVIRYNSGIVYRYYQAIILLYVVVLGNFLVARHLEWPTTNFPNGVTDTTQHKTLQE
jgi:hypothetical protein